ncbi:hypothetical protein KKF17_03400 [Patescibacteria group bacterium]|nr:hypothetical protein [Patescibacteria group bacterium]
MKAPKLKFKFDSKFDLEIAWNFYNSPKYAGIDFWKKGALQYHDELKVIEKKQRKKIYLSDYVASLYKQHKDEFEYRRKEIEALYKKKGQQFFCETEKIFKNHPWPKGKYIAFLSIFDFCPRFIDDKTFFIFMYDNDKGILFTIFHEMLHFIFYDYCLTKYPRIFKNQSTEGGSFWELAELFNSAIQQTPTFVKLHGQIDGIGYPELKSKFKEAKKAWNGDIDDWIATFGMRHVENF